jgi:TRAP-type mannitol/chloroaromatic compound transport system permease small subunit
MGRTADYHFRGNRKRSCLSSTTQRIESLKEREMPKPIRLFVKYVDALNYYVGRFAMYLFFVLGACLLYSTFSRVVLGVPVNWVLEMSQFLLSAYYLLGGAYAMQQGAHVRMDLFFDRLTPRKKAITDMITILFIIFYLGVMVMGGISSTNYAITYSQKNYTAWAPLLWPIKLIMTVGIFLLLLQCISNFFKDWASLRGKPINTIAGPAIEEGHHI